MLSPPRSVPMPWLVRGDIDGFFGLALDNFVQVLLIGALCAGVLGFGPELLFARVLPGVAVSLLFGNLFYAWQARRLSAREGRQDVCALPYGLNTVSIIGFVFLVMLPAKSAALASGLSAETSAHVAWQAGLVACMGSALIEFLGAFVAARVRAATPRAALLATLAGIALTFIALGFLYRSFANPLVGLATLAVVLLTYFGRVRFRGGIPGGLVAVVLGSLLAALTGIGATGEPAQGLRLALPVPVFGELVAALSAGHLTTYLAVIIPMGVFNLVGSLQNLESAEAAGDAYPTAPSLAVNGIGSLAAALFGSCFPTTIYIGHPGWKAMGARAGYSVLNGVAMTLLCLGGALAWAQHYVPIEAGMAIVLWIGIVIGAQAFQAVPREHAPAVVMGLLPALGAWGALMAKFGVKVGALLTGQDLFLDPGLVGAFNGFDVWAHGMFALEQGFIFASMILAAATVHVIEREFFRAAAWCGIGAVLCLGGLMHSYVIVPGDTVLASTPATAWALGYAAMAVVFLLARWLTVADETTH